MAYQYFIHEQVQQRPSICLLRRDEVKGLMKRERLQVTYWILSSENALSARLHHCRAFPFFLQ